MAILEDKYNTKNYLLYILLAFTLTFMGMICEASTLKTTNIQNDSLHYNNFLFYRTKDIDQALLYAKKSLSQGSELRDSVLIIKSYNAIGYCYDKTLKLDSALLNYKIGLAVSNKIENHLRSMYFMNSIGNVYDNSGIYDSALVYFYGSLDLAKELGRQKDEAIALTNIGNVNFDLGLKQTAIDFYERAVVIKEELNNAGLETTYYNIGLCYAELDNHEKALEYFQKLITLCSEGKCSDYSLDRGLMGMGMTSWVLGNLDDCEYYVSQVLDSKEENIRMLAFRYLSFVNNKRGDYLSALSNIKTSNSYAERLNNKEALKTNFEHQADIYKSIGRLDSAIMYYDYHFALKDSLFNENVAGSIQDMFIRLERKQAQGEIDAQKKRLETQKVIVILMTLVIVLASFLGWYIIRDLLKRKKQNLYLDKQVNLKTKQLQVSNIELKEKKLDLDNLIYKISHDIRAPLARLQGLIQVGRIDKKVDVFDKLESESNDLEKILNQMAVVNSINHHKIIIEKIDLEKFVNKIIKKYAKQWGNVAEFKVVMNEAILSSDIELLEISLYNLIDNAINFRIWGNPASILIGYTNGVLFVEDNGQGFDPKVKNKLTDLFFVANEKGGTGIGLHHTLLAIQKLGAKLEIPSAHNPTRFEIHFI